MAAPLHVLCVDDEPRLLEGLVLSLARHYRVSTATNGQSGLDIVDGNDSPAIVISDLRMPEMDGAVFLSQVKERSPDTVRLLLTGQADLEPAIAAVNHGQIFRFLTKPCKTQVLLASVHAAADQHRLITAERDLLEKTLWGSVRTLTEVLSLANPLAFGRAMRLKQHAEQLVAGLGVPFSWQLEVACMLSQIGCIALPMATNAKLYYGKPLGRDEVEATARLPMLASQLLESIPRLEAVRGILQAQACDFDGSGTNARRAQGGVLPLGARVLRLVSDYDTLEAAGLDPADAVATLRERKGSYDPRLLEVLARTKTKVAPEGMRALDLSSIQPGMLVTRDIVSTSGFLLVGRGYQVTAGLLQRLRNLGPGSVQEPISVFVPPGLTPTRARNELPHED